MIIRCRECGASNHDNLAYCSSCGSQLTLPSTPLTLPSAPRMSSQNYEELPQNLRYLSQRNEDLEEQLRKTTEEIATLAEQLKIEEQAHRAAMERELAQRTRVVLLEGRLEKAVTEQRNLLMQVRNGELIYRREIGRISEFGDVRSRYCDICGGALMSTQDPEVDFCPTCNLYWQPMAETPAFSVAQPSLESQQDYAHPFSMHAGRSWHGIFIHENCRFCGQQLTLTSDPNVLCCQYCGRYQPHNHR